MKHLILNCIVIISLASCAQTGNNVGNNPNQKNLKTNKNSIMNSNTLDTITLEIGRAHV